MAARFDRAGMLLVVCVGVVLAASMWAFGFANQRGHDWPHGRCFPRSEWSDAQRYRPCVRITRVEEDGSFTFAAQDHDGTVRYRSGVGAQDR